MKLIAILISIYFLALTAMPCRERPMEDVTAQCTTSHGATGHNEADHCSPFCTCNCCANPMVCQITAVVFQVSIVSQKHETSYSTLFATHLHSDIWQPPQLS